MAHPKLLSNNYLYLLRLVLCAILSSILGYVAEFGCTSLVGVFSYTFRWQGQTLMNIKWVRIKCIGTREEPAALCSGWLCVRPGDVPFPALQAACPAVVVRLTAADIVGRAADVLQLPVTVGHRGTVGAQLAVTWAGWPQFSPNSQQLQSITAGVFHENCYSVRQ